MADHCTPESSRNAFRQNRRHAGAAVAAAIDALAKTILFSQQDPEEGYWCGELEADTTLESDYILLHTSARAPAIRARTRKVRRRNSCAIRTTMAAGPSYTGGPSNISASVKAYFALKLVGYKPDHPVLSERARRFWSWAASPRSTPSPRCISASSGSTTTTLCRPFRRRSCCSPTGSGSTSTRFLRGRAPSWCRSAICLRQEAVQEDFRRRWASTSCLSAAARSQPAPEVGPRRSSVGGTSSWCSTAWCTSSSVCISVRCARWR